MANDHGSQAATRPRVSQRPVAQPGPVVVGPEGHRDPFRAGQAPGRDGRPADRADSLKRRAGTAGFSGNGPIYVSRDNWVDDRFRRAAYRAVNNYAGVQHRYSAESDVYLAVSTGRPVTRGCPTLRAARLSRCARTRRGMWWSCLQRQQIAGRGPARVRSGCRICAGRPGVGCRRGRWSRTGWFGAT